MELLEKLSILSTKIDKLAEAKLVLQQENEELKERITFLEEEREKYLLEKDKIKGKIEQLIERLG